MTNSKHVDERQDADLRDRLNAMETKVKKMRETRGNLNDSANVFADQRNAIQKRYKEHKVTLDEKLEERKAIRELIKEHKARRNSIQDQLKDLFGSQKSSRNDEKGGRSAAGEYNKLKSEIANLETVMETSGRVSLVKEKEYLKDIKNMRRRIEELEPEVKQFEIVKVDLTDMDAAIATLKSEADMAHQLMLEQVKLADGMQEELDSMFSERDFLKAEGDRLHDAFVEEKEKANLVHEKISQLLTDVTEIRNEMKAQRQERESWMIDHNASVASELRSGSDDDDVAENLVSELLEHGELSMGGTLSSDSTGGSGRKKKKKKGTIFSASRTQTKK